MDRIEQQTGDCARFRPEFSLPSTGFPVAAKFTMLRSYPVPVAVYTPFSSGQTLSPAAVLLPGLLKCGPKDGVCRLNCNYQFVGNHLGVLIHHVSLHL